MGKKRILSLATLAIIAAINGINAETYGSMEGELNALMVAAILIPELQFDEQEVKCEDYPLIILALSNKAQNYNLENVEWVVTGLAGLCAQRSIRARPGGPPSVIITKFVRNLYERDGGISDAGSVTALQFVSNLLAVHHLPIPQEAVSELCDVLRNAFAFCSNMERPDWAKSLTVANTEENEASRAGSECPTTAHA